MPRPKGSSSSHGMRTPESLGKPKGRKNSFAFFVETCRREHQKQHPDEIVEFGEFGKKCGERWRTMSEKEKKRFNQMAEVDAKRFEVEMESFKARQQLAVITGKFKKNGKKSSKKLKDPNAPRRAMAATMPDMTGHRKGKRLADHTHKTAFFLFAKDARPKVREANPNFSVGEISKELGRRWNEASQEVKSKYEQEAEKDRHRYTREKREYQDKLKGITNDVDLDVSDVEDLDEEESE